MNKILLILITLLLALVRLCTAQTNIPYGSNKGKYETVNGIKLYYEEYGKGTPVFVIHGGLSSIKDMAAVIPELSKKFRVIAVDCPGQGRSEQADSVSYQLMADHFNKMIDQLKLDSVYVVGYSDGAMTGLLMAADRPDKIKRIAAFAATSDTSGLLPGIVEGLDQMTPEAVETNFRWWLDTHLKLTPQKDKWKKFITDFREMCLRPVMIPEEKLKKINTQVLLIQGDNDIVKPEHGVKLFRSINGSQLCIVPAASHFILFEKPETFNYLVMEFLTKDKKLFDWTQLK